MIPVGGAIGLAALLALSGFPTPNAPPELRARLQVDRFRVSGERLQAQKELFALGDEAIPALVAGLSDSERLVRVYSVLTLEHLALREGGLGAAELDVRDALAALLGDASAEARAYAAALLARVGDRRGLPVLRSFAASDDALLRDHCRGALALGAGHLVAGRGGCR